jgi:hypothetical protein
MIWIIYWFLIWHDPYSTADSGEKPKTGDDLKGLNLIFLDYN